MLHFSNVHEKNTATIAVLPSNLSHFSSLGLDLLRADLARLLMPVELLFGEYSELPAHDQL